MKQLLRKMSSAELQELVDLIAGCTCSNVTNKTENEEATGEKLVQSDIKDYFNIVIFNFETLNKSVKEYKESIEDYILEKEQEFSETFAELSALREKESKGYSVEKNTIDKLNKQVNDLAKIIKDKSAGASKSTPGSPTSEVRTPSGKTGDPKPRAPGKGGARGGAAAPKPPTTTPPAPAKPPTTTPPRPLAAGRGGRPATATTASPRPPAAGRGGPRAASGQRATKEPITSTRIPDIRIASTSASDTKTAIISTARKMGYDDFAVKTVFANIMKEAGGRSGSIEDSYAGTKASNIKGIFKTRLGGKSDEFVNKLKKNDVDFFNYVYGGLIGNDKKNDGYTYRGRGLFQLTGKANYKIHGDMIGVDLVANPDLARTPEIEMKIVFAYLQSTLGNKRKFSSQLDANERITAAIAGKKVSTLYKEGTHVNELFKKVIETTSTIKLPERSTEPTVPEKKTQPIIFKKENTTTDKLRKQEKTRTVILPVILGYK
jgi:predicted chitinase